MKTTTEAQTAPGMPETAAHGAEARPMLAGAEASVWTERMLSALANGVKGGKFHPGYHWLACVRLLRQNAAQRGSIRSGISADANTDRVWESLEKALATQWAIFLGLGAITR